jgi:hypothetical protein
MSKNNKMEAYFLKIMEKYDRGEPTKDRLFTDLANKFQLDLSQSFILQVEAKIGRALSDDEKTKVKVLEFYKYHSQQRKKSGFGPSTVTVLKTVTKKKATAKARRSK